MWTVECEKKTLYSCRVEKCNARATLNIEKEKKKKEKPTVNQELMVYPCVTWLNLSPRLNFVQLKEIKEWKQGCLTFQELTLGPKAIIFYANKESYREREGYHSKI